MSSEFQPKHAVQRCLETRSKIPPQVIACFQLCFTSDWLRMVFVCEYSSLNPVGSYCGEHKAKVSTAEKSQGRERFISCSRWEDTGHFQSHSTLFEGRKHGAFIRKAYACAYGKAPFEQAHSRASPFKDIVQEGEMVGRIWGHPQLKHMSSKV